jgi:hypothetical protein
LEFESYEEQWAVYFWAKFEIVTCLNEMKGKISAAPDAVSRDLPSPRKEPDYFDWLSLLVFSANRFQNM